MSDVHPSGTAGDGRRVHTKTPAAGDTKVDKRIRCAQCGFFVNPDRETQGDSIDTLEAKTTVTVTVANTRASLPQPLKNLAGHVSTDFLATSRTVTESVKESGVGCPFCGSQNPTGKGRKNSPFDKFRDLSNR